MKTIRLPLIFLLSLSVFSTQCRSVQTDPDRVTAKEAAVKKLLESREYRFVPQTMHTQSAGSVQVYNHFLDLKDSTLVSALPYFGVSRSPEVGSSTGPLNFTSTDFSYTSEAHRKGNTLINIRLKNQFLDVREIYLNVSSTGSANVKVQFNNRQPVSFFGDVRPLPVKR